MYAGGKKLLVGPTLSSSFQEGMKIEREVAYLDEPSDWLHSGRSHYLMPAAQRVGIVMTISHFLCP